MAEQKLSHYCSFLAGELASIKYFSGPLPCLGRGGTSALAAHKGLHEPDQTVLLCSNVPWLGIT